MKGEGDPGSAVVVLTTLPDPAAADRLAGTLVAEGLAACVTRIPGARSTYRWEGRVEEAEEILLLIKTRAARVGALRDRLLALHPYEVPEFLVLPVASGHAAYLEWIAGATKPEEGA